jgi:hypothetical protein
MYTQGSIARSPERHTHDRVEEGDVAESRVVAGQAPTERDEQQDVGGRGFDAPGVIAQEEGEPRDQDDQDDRQENLEQVVVQMARRAEAKVRRDTGSSAALGITVPEWSDIRDDELVFPCAESISL